MSRGGMLGGVDAEAEEADDINDMLDTRAKASVDTAHSKKY